MLNTAAGTSIQEASQTRSGLTLRGIRDFLDGRAGRALLSVYHQPDYRQQPNTEWMVSRACEVIRADMESGEANVVPTFFPDFGTVSTAAMYGGKLIPASAGGGVHIEPVVQNVADLLELRPCPFEESDFQRAIDLYRQVCARLGTDEVYLRTPDFQGPLNTLALMIDQTELMIGMMEQPELIKTVLGRITDTLIEYAERYRNAVGPIKVVGSIWPYFMLPEGMGLSLTQDYMPLIGAEQYAEFEVPLLKRIADRFGGVYIHCCGEYGRHLPVLAASGMKIWGIEAHYPETKVDDVYAAFGDRVVMVPYISPRGAAKFPTLAAFVRSLAGKPCAKGRFWFCWCPEWGGTDELRAAVHEVFGEA